MHLVLRASTTQEANPVANLEIELGRAIEYPAWFIAEMTFLYAFSANTYL